MGFPKQEYWSALPSPSPGDLPNPRTEPRSPTLQADFLSTEFTRDAEFLSAVLCFEAFHQNSRNKKSLILYLVM